MKTKAIWLGLCLWTGLLGAGCNTYSYAEVHVMLDDAWSTPLRAMIHTCHLFVTGADTTDTTLKHCSPPESNDVGTFEYSTFTDSGTLNFKLKAFEGTGETNQIGDGTASVVISSGNTAVGTMTVMYIGPPPQP
ncbi:MAG: hypothetical protein QOI66_4336 [Myxococcales bacterium]|nr:hypothetical protein [Myxococcales bacterium]